MARRLANVRERNAKVQRFLSYLRYTIAKDDTQKKNKRAQSGEDAFNEEKENSNAVSVKAVSGLGKKLKALAVKS